MIRSGVAILALALLTGAAGARPLTPAEGRYWSFSGRVPVCHDDGVLGRIQSRFSQRERGYWQSGLEIQSFAGVRETGLRTAGVDLIPKRYCDAKAVMNDGKVRHVRYWIGENQGIIGWSWGVEWCVVGLDRHNAFGPSCRTAGP